MRWSDISYEQIDALFRDDIERAKKIEQGMKTPYKTPQEVYFKAMCFLVGTYTYQGKGWVSTRVDSGFQTDTTEDMESGVRKNIPQALQLFNNEQLTHVPQAIAQIRRIDAMLHAEHVDAIKALWQKYQKDKLKEMEEIKYAAKISASCGDDYQLDFNKPDQNKMIQIQTNDPHSYFSIEMQKKIDKYNNTQQLLNSLEKNYSKNEKKPHEKRLQAYATLHKGDVGEQIKKDMDGGLKYFRLAAAVLALIPAIILSLQKGFSFWKSKGEQTLEKSEQCLNDAGFKFTQSIN